MAQTRIVAQNATATEVRTGATRVKKVSVRQKTSDAPRLYLQLFNILTPTVGTTVPVDVFRVPVGDAARQPPWEKYIFASSFGGKFYDTGLSFAVTTTPTGLTAPDSGDEPEVIVDWEPLGT